MNKASEFVSKVVDEIERRKCLKRLRSNLSWSAGWIEKNVKERDIVQSKLDNLNKRLSWWNRWFLSKIIKQYKQELERLNNNISIYTKMTEIILKNIKWNEGYEPLQNER